MNIRTRVESVLLLLIAVLSHAEQKIKLTGAEPAERIDGYKVLAERKARGPGFNFMLAVYHKGTHGRHWNIRISSGIDYRQAQVQKRSGMCHLPTPFAGQEQCYDDFKFGDNRRESWLNGKYAFS